jgi:hypothetical protein
MSIKNLVARLQLRRKTLVLFVILVATLAVSYQSVFRYKSLKETGQSVEQATQTNPADSSDTDSSAAVTVEPTPLPTEEELGAIDTSSWKIYDNSQYGYEISYPTEWTVTARGDYQVNFLAPGEKIFSAEEPGEGNVSISMEEDKNGTSEFMPSQYTEMTTVKLGGKEAAMYSGIPGGQDAKTPSGVYTVALLRYDGKVLMFNFLDDIADKDDGKYLAYYEKMLSTFKLIK